MKCTPLFKTHQKYGAKFTEFNGWNMPLWFSSLENEHLQVCLLYTSDAADE